MKKLTDIKASASTTLADTKLAIKNFERLAEATALLVVTGYTLKQAFEMAHTLFFYVLVVAGAIVALRGAVEFLRHLTNK
jgi:hypothetical protein